MAQDHKTLLIVDDDINFNAALEALLKSEYNISTAQSGLNAIELLSSGLSPDLILLDVSMPVIDGFKTCCRIKSMQGLADIPVIFITGVNDAKDEEKGFEVGAVDFVSKPIKPTLLRHRINLHLKQSDLRKQVVEQSEQLSRALATSRQNEAYLQSVLTSAPVGIGMIVGREIQWVNARMSEMVGYPEAELKHMDSRMLYRSDEEYRRVGMVKYEQIRASGIGRVETQLVTKNGRLIDVLVCSTPVDAEDLSAGVLFTAQDISTLKSNQLSLEKSQATLKQAQKIAKIGSWRYDSENNKIEWSDEVYSIFEVDPETTVLSLDFIYSMTHPEDRDSARKSFITSLKQHTPHDEIHRILTPLGNLKFVHERYDIEHDEEKNTVVAIGTIQDVTHIKQAEEQLKESQEYLRVLSDASFEAIFLSDNGHCIGQNKTAERMFGIGSDEVSGRRITDWFVNYERDAVRQYVKSKSGEPFETVAQKYDGSVFPAEIQVRQMVYQQRDICLMALSDITRRKVKENIVKTQLHLSRYAENHTIHQLLVEFLDHTEGLTTSQVGFFHFVDEERGAVTFQAWSKNTLDNLCQLKDLDQHHPIDQAGIWVDCVRQRKTTIQNNYIGMPDKKGLPDGHIPMVRELVVPIIRDEKVVAILGVGNKQTEYNQIDTEIVETLAELAWDLVIKKRQEERIVLAKEEWEATFDAMTDMITILDHRMKIVRANKAFFERLGLPPGDDLKGQSFDDVFWSCPKCHPDWPQVKTVTDGKSHSEVIYCRHAGDSYLVTSVVMPSMEAAHENILVVARDITEQRRYQLESERSSRLASLGELAAGVAHEINNPNALILYNSELLDKIFADLVPSLKTQASSLPELPMTGFTFSEAVDEIPGLGLAIHDSALRIKRIVNDLRDFARQEDGDFSELIDINDSVMTTVRLVHNTVKKATDRFSIELGDGLPRVRGVKGRLEQVLINLLMNACQSLQSRDKKVSIYTKFDQSDGYVKLVVQDEGAGIPEDLIDKIIEPFVTTKREQGGTGLGLSVSDRIVKEHNGRLEFDSQPGRGTAVTLCLPRDEEG